MIGIDMSAELTTVQKARQKSAMSGPQWQALRQWSASADREESEIKRFGEVVARPARDQPQLFDTGRMRGPRPAEMTPEKWIEHHGNDVVFHGTFRGDDVQYAPIVHAGTRQAAIERMRNVVGLIHADGGRRYFNPSTTDDDFEWEEDEDGEPQRVVEGHMLAFRLNKLNTSKNVVPDSVANSADVLHQVARTDFQDISAAVADSASFPVRRLAEKISHDPEGVSFDDWRDIGKEAPQVVNTMRQLRAGRAIPYLNMAEDHGSRSWMVPRNHGVSTWEHDVVDDPRSHPMVRDFAQRRIDSGQAGRVAFDVDKVDPRRIEEQSLGGRTTDRKVTQGTQPVVRLRA